MILADTSVWIAHFRAPDAGLMARLEAEDLLGHPFVIGEMAMGNLGQRSATLQFLDDLPKAVVASHDEVMSLVERHRLIGLGIGYIDAHLLASALLTNGTTLWTRDRRLHAIAERLGLATDTALTSH